MTYTATVTPAPGGGTVAFSDNGHPIRSCTAQAVRTSGTATCAVHPPSVGSHAIVAIYSGTASYAGSMSPPLSQVVRLPAHGHR